MTKRRNAFSYLSQEISTPRQTAFDESTDNGHSTSVLHGPSLGPSLGQHGHSPARRAAGEAAQAAAPARHALHPRLRALRRPAAGQEAAAGSAASESTTNCWRERKEEATVSGKPVPEGRWEGRATGGSREGGLTPRAHLLWQRVCDSEGSSSRCRKPKKIMPLRTEALLTAAGRGRQQRERTEF